MPGRYESIFSFSFRFNSGAPYVPVICVFNERCVSSLPWMLLALLASPCDRFCYGYTITPTILCSQKLWKMIATLKTSCNLSWLAYRCHILRSRNCYNVIIISTNLQYHLPPITPTPLMVYHSNNKVRWCVQW